MKLFMNNTGCIEKKGISLEMLLCDNSSFKFLHLRLGKMVHSNTSEKCEHSLLWNQMRTSCFLIKGHTHVSWRTCYTHMTAEIKFWVLKNYLSLEQELWLEDFLLDPFSVQIFHYLLNLHIADFLWSMYLFISDSIFHFKSPWFYSLSPYI